MKARPTNMFQLKNFETPAGYILNYQSIQELNFIKQCIKCNIEIMNGDRIPYYTEDGKLHYYFVDFKIKVGNQYQLVEIKGTHKWYYESLQNGILKAKINAAAKYSADNNYLPYRFILDGKEIKVC